MAVKPEDCSWCRSVCRMSHSGTGCHRCACACVTSSCVWRRKHVDTWGTDVADGLRASSCASEGLTDAGKPDHRLHTRRVFPRCGHVHVHATQLHSQTHVHTGHTGDVSSVPSAQLAHVHTLHACHHRPDMGLDAESVCANNTHYYYKLN